MTTSNVIFVKIADRLEVSGALKYTKEVITFNFLYSEKDGALYVYGKRFFVNDLVISP